MGKPMNENCSHYMCSYQILKPHHLIMNPYCLQTRNMPSVNQVEVSVVVVPLLARELCV
jgi:hypothetical protein